jgi:protein-disulfide isomerase-like protein with CxxC motif
MPEIRIPTDAGGVVVDTFDDDPATEAVDAPSHLDERTLAFLARVQRKANERIRDAEQRAQRVAAAAEHETKERIAADLESMGSGRALLMAPGAAAARVRSLAWARSAA